MLINNMLISDSVANALCASLQPNSRLRQTTAGMRSMTGLNAGSFGLPGSLAAFGTVIPSGANRLAMPGAALQGTTMPIFGLGCANIAATGIMGGIYVSPAMRHAGLTGNDWNNDNDTGIPGTFNKNYTGRHTRLYSGPPPAATSAPPGRVGNAGPEGGPPAD